MGALRFTLKWTYRNGQESVSSIQFHPRPKHNFSNDPCLEGARSDKRFEPGTIAAWLTARKIWVSPLGRGGTAKLNLAQTREVMKEFGLGDMPAEMIDFLHSEAA